MTPLNILLSESMQEFIKARIAESGYSTASEYIEHLIREDQKQAARSQLEAKLIEGLHSGKPIEVTDEWWEQKRSELLQRVHQQNQ
ncbi:ribbon-helix-helix domain-containing protein [Laspinema olomoucense]|uniref:ribbon-helix-helix domain-containing protein n=1 Tax=Laspinema olomoucense TaxID=3231600 RepID=UPI0021BA65C2|nr:type II toxin-antitoxin system ParD family antitoxin [Laspinema sp. D3c]MCT7996333.1 type II toxin-antitoxin system ParD family antitoxin [Laspinema sp. D3c]